MDWAQFFEASVAGVPLLLVVIGLVEWVKRLGLRDKGLQAASAGIGLALGVAYQLSQAEALPQTFGGWFGVAVYGLALGLVASGVYDAAGSVAAKAGLGKPGAGK